MEASASNGAAAEAALSRGELLSPCSSAGPVCTSDLGNDSPGMDPLPADATTGLQAHIWTNSSRSDTIFTQGLSRFELLFELH